MTALRAMPAFLGNDPGYETRECERVADAIGLPKNHWLADAVADALDTGDAIYLLRQCRKHLAPRIKA